MEFGIFRAYRESSFSALQALAHTVESSSCSAPRSRHSISAGVLVLLAFLLMSCDPAVFSPGSEDITVDDLSQDASLVGVYDAWTYSGPTGWIRIDNQRLSIAGDSLMMSGVSLFPAPGFESQKLGFSEGQISLAGLRDGARQTIFLYDYILQNESAYGTRILWLRAEATPLATIGNPPSPALASGAQILCYIPVVNTPTSGESTTCTVTFDSLGGSVMPPLLGVESGSTIASPQAAPTKEGFAFAGWYRDASNSLLWNFSSDVVVSSMTLYAKWVEELNIVDGSVSPPSLPANHSVHITGPGSVHIGFSASYRVEYSGEALSYQWFVQGESAAGAGGSEYVLAPIPGVTSLGATLLSLVITDANGLEYVGNLLVDVLE